MRCMYVLCKIVSLYINEYFNGYSFFFAKIKNIFFYFFEIFRIALAEALPRVPLIISNDYFRSISLMFSHAHHENTYTRYIHCST